jgi:hypothetical protein
MRRQTEIKTPGPLLDEKGVLIQRGYATQPLLTYRRDAIKAPPWRIKEWDFYQVLNDDYCLQFTVGHASYAGALTVSFFRFEDQLRYDREEMLLLPFNSLKMPQSSSQGLSASRGGVSISFEVEERQRILRCKTTADKKTPPMEGEIRLRRPHDTSIVMAIPFHEYEEAFYYNEKISCMTAEGSFRIGDEVFEFSPTTSFGLLDWGRGVWPYSTDWYWGSGSGLVGGVPFGFNIGFGFGDSTAASENMLFYDGEAHKISEINLDLYDGGLMSKKQITSDDGSFEMEFTPVYNRYMESKILFVSRKCNMLFGYFNGHVRLNDGRELEVKDLMAFAEHSANKW